MLSRCLAPASMLCGALLLLVGCASPESAIVPQTDASAAPAASAGGSVAGEAPSQDALDGIPIEEMTHQPVPVQMTQCLTQQAKWIDLPAGKTSSDLYTRIAAHEQELLFLLPDEVGGFDNVDVAAGPGPRGTVGVSVVGSAAADPAAVWQALRDATPEVDTAAAGIEAEGASFAPKLVDFSYATLCKAALAVTSLWKGNDDGLVSVRMDVELNRLILGIDAATLSDSYRQELLETAPAGIFEFEDVQ
ncbi:hypothetical protein [Pseudoclavibacter sp. RFBB5]|uniref:hypothetical protein n=1 Tax=Pseudoclavibacter sp. RFBB5 TaxID=2080574 RepID=UPI000CE7B8D9|nr:hypothetical protein [Pseudoclavibacter sp. RFBB5]PPG27145.1 hypothetical protein C5B97_17110 [Pseudoclavibacter sp. RFBB5]